ncbi:MAG: hypothetical protein AAFS10_20770 [Myxococcota bacterium]
MYQEPRRARRRRLTRKVAQRRRQAHIVWSHAYLQELPSSCICARSVQFFSKRPALKLFWWHRKRIHQRPRLSFGDLGERDRIYLWRNQSRELNRLVTRHQDVDLYSDEVSILADPKTNCSRFMGRDRDPWMDNSL